MNFHQNQIINECAKKILAYYMTFNDLWDYTSLYQKLCFHNVGTKICLYDNSSHIIGQNQKSKLVENECVRNTRI